MATDATVDTTVAIRTLPIAPKIRATVERPLKKATIRPISKANIIWKASATKNRIRKTPNIGQRLPFVRARLRDIAPNMPSRSCISTGTETDMPSSHLMPATSNTTKAMIAPKIGTNIPAMPITMRPRIMAKKTISPTPSVGNMLRKAIWMRSPIAGRLPFRSSIVACTSEDWNNSAQTK
ncbi:hypothetical protein [Mesorhizobium sp. M1252]|uniref:hypothetical protein n=1 Tax=Mesorhizobium sp. M1252 TaxID=2957073 RepID=UPI00333C439E